MICKGTELMFWELWKSKWWFLVILHVFLQNKKDKELLKSGISIYICGKIDVDGWTSLQCQASVGAIVEMSAIVVGIGGVFDDGWSGIVHYYSVFMQLYCWSSSSW